MQYLIELGVARGNSRLERCRGGSGVGLRHPTLFGIPSAEGVRPQGGMGGSTDMNLGGLEELTPRRRIYDAASDLLVSRVELPSAARMRALAIEFPNQLLEGYRAARELPPGPRSAKHAVVVGMGGSAIAADLAMNLTEPETELPLGVTRGPLLPRSVGPDSWAVFASYSGQTWETLTAYDEARRRRAPRLTIGSGGELEARAERDGVPHLMLPPGLPPRAALGYMLGGLLGALDPFFPESNDRRLRQAAEGLRRLETRFSAARGPAAVVASRLEGRIPHIYADTSFGGLARRWKTQIEENSKRLAEFDLVPELFHNALVAWDAMSPAEARRHAVVMLEWEEESPVVRWGFRYLEELLHAKGVTVISVPLDSIDRLEALLEGVAFGDHVSLFMAEQARVDPQPVEAITRLKKAQEAGLDRPPSSKRSPKSPKRPRPVRAKA